MKVVLIKFPEVEWLSHSLGMGRTGIGSHRWDCRSAGEAQSA